MRPLALGTHNTIAYTFDEGSIYHPNYAELKRYDVVTGSKTVIVHLPQVRINEAQVSADGQWLLFMSGRGIDPGSTLQLVRMDGQGLQTLYCSPDFIEHVQWSPDQRMVIFSARTIQDRAVPYLLTLSTGTVQQEVLLPSYGLGFIARTWVDNTRIYLVDVPTDVGSLENLYILDTAKGREQNVSALAPVTQGSSHQYCWDFDSDYRSTELITSSCTVSFPPGSYDNGVQQGPSSIAVQSTTGSSGHTTFTSQNLAITHVRFLGYSSDKLLLTSENQNAGTATTNDTSTNGLWWGGIDGSHLKHIFTVGAGKHCEFNRYTQYPWSNASVVGSLYSLQVTDSQGDPAITKLYFGSLHDNAATSFAFAQINVEMVEVAGWTLM